MFLVVFPFAASYASAKKEQILESRKKLLCVSSRGSKWHAYIYIYIYIFIYLFIDLFMYFIHYVFIYLAPVLPPNRLLFLLPTR